MKGFGIRANLKKCLFFVLRFAPLQDKVIASTMRGRYGDNPQFIFETLHSQRPDLDLVWLTDPYYNSNLPKWVREVRYYGRALKLIYELSTAKVWINTHRFESWWKKRPGQLVVETWHGGLGIKKIEMDCAQVRKSQLDINEIRNTCKLADVFISQSTHLSNIYRRAFGYKGPIWKCGYPKNDSLFLDRKEARCRIRSLYMIKEKIALYAPTMRLGDIGSSCPTKKPYSIDWDALHNALCKKFGGEWTILVKWHPVLRNTLSSDFITSKYVIDVTKHSDMQELLRATDFMISDYSSCIFDAALLNIPCFTYATDFEEYKSERGVYYEMDELPFPYARDNQELIKNILEYNHDQYIKKWEKFKKDTGLYETGHASKDIAEKILQFIDTGTVEWN